MASVTASALAPRATCRTTSVNRPAARSSVILCAARQQEQKAQQPSKVAQIAAAGLATLFVVATPAFAAAESGSSLKNKICASNPTSKICLRDSVKGGK